MRKKIRFFKQHSLVTCGPACMLMLLDLYGKIPYPTSKYEMQLYSIYKSKVFLGVNGAAIAKCLSNNNLAVHLVHSSSQMMDNRDGYFPEELFAKLLTEYQAEAEKCADQIQISTGADITCATLRQELDAGRQVILETIIPGDADGIHDYALHWILIYGYEGNIFLACDPLCSKKELTATKLEELMETPIGKIYIAVGKNS